MRKQQTTNAIYYVSCQIYWPDEEHIVEIALGGQQYANPDMLVVKYSSLGEGREYADPVEAAKAAIAIKDAWNADLRQDLSNYTNNGEGRITCPQAQVAHGATMGDTMPFEGESDEDVLKWAAERLANLECCDRIGCGTPLQNGSVYHLVDDPDDARFCSEYCAEEQARLDRQMDEEEDEANWSGDTSP